MKKQDINLEAELEGKKLLIKVEHDPRYQSPADHPIDKNTKRALKKGKVSFYNLLVAVDSDVHQLYLPSQILASDEKLLMKEINELISDDDFLNNIKK